MPPLLHRRSSEGRGKVVVVGSKAESARQLSLYAFGDEGAGGGKWFSCVSAKNYAASSVILVRPGNWRVVRQGVPCLLFGSAMHVRVPE